MTKEHYECIIFRLLTIEGLEFCVNRQKVWCLDRRGCDLFLVSMSYGYCNSKKTKFQKKKIFKSLTMHLSFAKYSIPSNPIGSIQLIQNSINI